MHLFGRRDPSLVHVIGNKGDLRTTTYPPEVFSVIALPLFERTRIAMSACRLRHIDFDSDCRTIAVPIATVDCVMDCYLQTNGRISGGRQ